MITAPMLAAADDCDVLARLNRLLKKSRPETKPKKLLQ